MKRHDYIVRTLVKSGFRASLRGFEQFCRCVEKYTEDRAQTIDSIYAMVALEYGCSKSAVEKNLRRLIESSDASAAIGKLFDTDFVETGNKEIVATFANYINTRHDDYD